MRMLNPFFQTRCTENPYSVISDSQSSKIYKHIAADLHSLLMDARKMFGANFNLAAHYGQTFNANDPANELQGANYV